MDASVGRGLFKVGCGACDVPRLLVLVMRPEAACTPLAAGDTLPIEAVYFISPQFCWLPFLLKIKQKQIRWGQLIPEGQAQ